MKKLVSLLVIKDEECEFVTMSDYKVCTLLQISNLIQKNVG